MYLLFAGGCLCRWLKLTSTVSSWDDSATSRRLVTCQWTAKVACWSLTSSTIAFYCWTKISNNNESWSTPTLRSNCGSHRGSATMKTRFNSMSYTVKSCPPRPTLSPYSTYTQHPTHHFPLRRQVQLPVVNFRSHPYSSKTVVKLVELRSVMPTESFIPSSPSSFSELSTGCRHLELHQFRLDIVSGGASAFWGQKILLTRSPRCTFFLKKVDDIFSWCALV